MKNKLLRRWYDNILLKDDFFCKKWKCNSIQKIQKSVNTGNS